MIGGEFDLSVGAVVGASSMIVAICSGYYSLAAVDRRRDRLRWSAALIGLAERR